MPDVWETAPTHGNSKRQCEIKRHGNTCGKRATHMSHVAAVEDDVYPENWYASVVYHCDDPRHVANAHKQVTEFAKRNDLVLA